MDERIEHRGNMILFTLMPIISGLRFLNIFFFECIKDMTLLIYINRNGHVSITQVEEKKNSSKFKF